jgi:hypothetical protein
MTKFFNFLCRPMWVRADGLPLGTLGDLVSGPLPTAIHVQANGNYSAQMEVLTGATAPTLEGDFGSTCNNWGSSAGRAQGGGLLGPAWAFVGFWPSCDSGAVVYCFQE